MEVVKNALSFGLSTMQMLTSSHFLTGNCEKSGSVNKECRVASLYCGFGVQPF